MNNSVVLIARHGKIVFFKAHGHNDLNIKAPLDKNGILQVASQTKALTTVAVMMLWEEGKFSLGDLVAKFISLPIRKIRRARPFRLSGRHDSRSTNAHIRVGVIGTLAESAIYAKNYVTGGVGIKGQKLSDTMIRLGSLRLFSNPVNKSNVQCLAKRST